MKFYTHWKRGKVEIEDQNGRRHQFSAWGWSDISSAEAERKGAERARGLGIKILNQDKPGRYSYGSNPLREEVIEEIKTDGRVIGAITLNAYGCQVLNTTEMMFIDVDLPETGGVQGAFQNISQHWNKPGLGAQSQKEMTSIAKIKAMVDGKSGWGVRVYRTKAGLRHLVLNASLPPASGESLEVMRQAQTLST